MGREEHHKHHWCLWGLLAVSGPHWVVPLMVCVFSWSTLLGLQVALQGNCLKWALGCVHFLGLSRSDSGSRVLHKAQTWLGLHFVPFPGPSSSGDQVLGECTLPCVWCILSPPRSQPLGFLGAQQERHLRCAVRLLWGTDLWLGPSWWMSTV